MINLQKPTPKNMKKISLLALVLATVACQNQDSLEAKKEELKEKQGQLAELQAEIKSLKEEISEKDTTAQPVAEYTPVKTKEVQPENFNHFVELTGTVDSRENILISAETNGRVVSVPSNEGEKVSRGQVLVRLDDQAVQSQFAEARAAFELAEKTYQKRSNLWEQNIGSEIEYLQAKNAYETTKSRLAQVRTQLENTVIKSPINGTVDDIMVNEGEFVSFGTPIIRVVDVDNVELEAELSEEYLPSIRKGDTAYINFPSLDIKTKAPISFVSQVINPENRSFKVKVAINNKNGRIKPNVLANMRLRDYAKDSAIVVPSKSISKDLKGNFVYTIQQENGELVARKKYITRGKVAGSETEIIKGLEPGDKVITTGYNQVNEGTAVEVRQAQ